jgi:hypothetical protein
VTDSSVSSASTVSTSSQRSRGLEGRRTGQRSFELRQRYSHHVDCRVCFSRAASRRCVFSFSRVRSCFSVLLLRRRWISFRGSGKEVRSNEDVLVLHKWQSSFQQNVRGGVSQVARTLVLDRERLIASIKCNKVCTGLLGHGTFVFKLCPLQLLEDVFTRDTGFFHLLAL